MAIIPVSGGYRSGIVEWAAYRFSMPAWHQVGECLLTVKDVIDVTEHIHSPAGSDSLHNCSGKGPNDGMNSQLARLYEIEDFSCRGSESVLSYAARKI